MRCMLSITCINRFCKEAAGGSNSFEAGRVDMCLLILKVMTFQILLGQLQAV
jgi:hypothetical protein